MSMPIPERSSRLHADFLSILPKIEKHARFAFRMWHNEHDREDAVQETIAIAWKWFQRLAAKGKDATRFPTTLASLSSRHVKCGRQLCGCKSPKDVLSPLARKRYGFEVEPLSQEGTLPGRLIQDALADNTQTPVPEAVAFRIDFPEWLHQLSQRDCRIVEELAMKHSTCDVASKFHVSPARVSQLRREYHQDWHMFHGELAEENNPLPARAA